MLHTLVALNGWYTTDLVLLAGCCSSSSYRSCSSLWVSHCTIGNLLACHLLEVAGRADWKSAVVCRSATSPLFHIPCCSDTPVRDTFGRLMVFLEVATEVVVSLKYVLPSLSFSSCKSSFVRKTWISDPRNAKLYVQEYHTYSFSDVALSGNPLKYAFSFVRSSSEMGCLCSGTFISPCFLVSFHFPFESLVCSSKCNTFVNAEWPVVLNQPPVQGTSETKKA